MRSGSSAERGGPVLPRDARAGIRRHPSVGARLIGIVDRNLHILFPLPALCLVVGLMVYPLVYTLLLSTRSYDLSLKSYHFIGLTHYLATLTNQRFWDAFGRTFYFTAPGGFVIEVLG